MQNFGKINKQTYLDLVKRLWPVGANRMVLWHLFRGKIIRKTKAYKLASEIINQVQLAGLILCLVYLKANTYILC